MLSYKDAAVNYCGLIGPAGLEPATPCLEGRCSIQAELRAQATDNDQHASLARNHARLLLKQLVSI